MRLPPNARSQRRYVWDLETDGLLPEVSRIHCAVATDIDTGEVHDFKPNEIGKFLELYVKARCLIGHNIIGYDIQVIAKLFGLRPHPECEIIDTLVLARLVFSDIKQTDFPLAKAWKKYKQSWDNREAEREAARERGGYDPGPLPGKRPQEFPGQFVGAHSLEAWGYRLGAERKGDYSKEMKAQGLDPWESWNEAMHAYMIQDAVVNLALWRYLMAQEPTSLSIALEMAVQFLCERMTRNGWPLDIAKAQELYATLSQRRQELEVALKAAFPPWEVRLEDFIPKRANKTKGYLAGVPVERWETREFNPASREHIADRLTNKYGWTPTEFTEGGQPKVDDDVLQALPYPEAKLLAEYFLIQKRIGQLGEGAQAWLKQVSKKGRLNGRYNTIGTVTGRMSHSNPNIAQVPSVGSPYGRDCRALFTVPRGWVQLGADQSGLELRCLGSFMAAFDGGKYIEIVLHGDIHFENAKALFGLPDDTVRDEKNHPEHKKYRDVAKTFIYAFLYGAGPEKLGSIPGVTPEEEKLWLTDPKHRKALIAIRDRAAKRKITLNRRQLLNTYKGQQLQAAFLRKFPALKKLLEYVKEAAGKGWLKGLDGRKLPIRSDHAALNTLLQSAGACVCKRWIVLAEEMLRDAGFVFSEGLKDDWDPEANIVFLGVIHDEIAVAVKPELADKAAAIIQEAGRRAGDIFPSWKCPTDVETKLGANWAETH